MKENFEKLKANRPEGINSNSWLSFYQYGGRLLALLNGVLGVALLRNGSFGKDVLESLGESEEMRTYLALDFLFAAIVFTTLAQVAKNSKKRNKYILEIEQMVEKEIKKDKMFV